jgi:hypothetical protein
MTWLNGIIGQGIAANISACGQMASNHQQAQQQAMAAQQAYNVGAQGMSQGTYPGQNWQPPKWMFAGEIMSFEKFVEKIFPEDCADKTAFVLKYSE